MIILHNFAEQQKIESEKDWKKNLKQTDDKKIAESFEPITKKLFKTTEAIEKLTLFRNKEEKSNQPAIENIQPYLEDAQNMSTEGVINELSLEHTVENMKKK